MKMVATSSGKRKAVDYSGGDLAKVLDRVEKLEQEVADLRKLISEGVRDSQHADNGQDDVSDLSDDEESVTNDSDPWMMMFQQLREYRIINGHCNVSSKENPKLKSWINNQKTAHRNLKTGTKGRSITVEKIVKLDSIGFNWGKGYPPQQSWDEMFAQLKNYQQKMGNCNIPFSAKNPSPIAKWIAIQRAEYKHVKQGRHSLLTLDQIGQLNEIGFKWKVPKMQK